MLEVCPSIADGRPSLEIHPLGIGGKEDPARLNERLGIASRPRPEGRLVWFHGASIGEAMAICRYFEELHPEPALFGRGALGKKHGLWRAVDQNDFVLEVLVQSGRNTRPQNS